MNARDLTGDELDAAVTRIEGLYVDAAGWVGLLEGDFYRPSTNWAQGGPIIERERILVGPGGRSGWSAFYAQEIEAGGGYYPGDSMFVHYGRVTVPATGPTALIAAMRSYVASKQEQPV